MPEFITCKITIDTATNTLLPIYLKKGASFHAAEKLLHSGSLGQIVGGDYQISSLVFRALVTIQ